MILFADEDLLVINKPSGLRSIPDGYIPSLPTVQSELQAEFGRVYIVHRLDKDTSGVMLLARNAESHRRLDRSFAERMVAKIYHALCAGTTGWEEKHVDLPLRLDGDRSHRTVVDPVKGKPASTIFRLIHQYEGYCLIEARPLTGYTHQIRAHLSVNGLPLLGDPLYKIPVSYKGARPDVSQTPAFPRTALHAWSLSVFHPKTGELLTFHAPYPPDFVKLITDV